MRSLALLALVACDAEMAAQMELGEVERASNEVERHQFSWVDESRGVEEMGGVAARDVRPLEVYVWAKDVLQEEREKRPLLLVAHGLGGDPEKLEAIATEWAEAGVMVAAPRFPSSCRDCEAGNLGIGDVVEQPDDLSFVLDQLLAESKDSNSELYASFDATQIVGLGHSLGGATMLGATRFDDREERLVATVLVAPAAFVTGSFGPTVSPSGPPTLLLNGLEDDVVHIGVSEGLYESFEDPVWLVGIEGAAHAALLESQQVPAIAERAIVRDCTLGFLEEVVGFGEASLDAELDALEAAGHIVRR